MKCEKAVPAPAGEPSTLASQHLPQTWAGPEQRPSQLEVRVLTVGSRHYATDGRIAYVRILFAADFVDHPRNGP